MTEAATAEYSPDLATVLAAVRRVALFARLEEVPLGVLAGEVTHRSIRKGEVLMREGDPGDNLLILTSGSVAILTSSVHGERVVVNVLRAPAHLGELALLDGSPRSATVEAMEEGDILTLSRSAFLRLLTTEPTLLAPLLRSLAGQMRHLTAVASDWVFLDLAGRLAKALVTLGDAASPGDGECVLTVTQARLAEMVGCSRQRVNEALAGFSGRGMVAREGRNLVLLDRAALRSRGGLS